MRIKYSLMTVAVWLCNMHDEGILHRYSSKQPRRPHKLTEDQLHELESILLHSPQGKEFPFLFWTTKLEQHYIEKEYRASYDSRQGRNLLCRMDMTYQKP